MSDPIKLKITKAGLEAALSADENGIILRLSKVKFSTDRFASVMNDERTTLNNVVVEAGIIAGGASLEQNTLRCFALVNSVMMLSIGSVGLYTDDDVLFAIASVENVGEELLKILPKITFVMSFGLTLAAVLLENVQVSIDPESSIAAALIFQHENNINPHPQYASQISLLNNKLNQISGNLATYVENATNTYPKTILSGVANGSNGYIDVSSKVPELRDNRYSILLTPEGGHEAHAISRSKTGFNFNIWDRSGTNRVGYSGQVSWAVVQNSADYQIGGNGDYVNAGVYNIPLIPGETKRIILIGGGGQGGASRYSGGWDYSGNNGRAGKNSIVSINGSTLAIAGGGNGGTVGVWGNGSSYSNGAAGAGGTTTHNASALNVLQNRANGVAGSAWRENHTGGSVSNLGGRGGNGQNGVGDEGWSFGGGGGSGGYIEFTYRNDTNSIAVLVLEVGEGGINPDAGESGQTGFARVQTV